MLLTRESAIRRYIRIFVLGFTIVFLVAGNTKQIVWGHYAGAMLGGWLISFFCAMGVQKIHHEGVIGAIVYASGAASGTVAAMWVTSLIYGH